MFSHPRGCLPGLSWVIGSVILIFGILALVSNVYGAISDSPQYEYLESTAQIVGYSAIFTFAFLPFLLVGYGITQVFPGVRITAKGLWYWTPLTILPKLIVWDEIEDIIDLKWPPGCKAIVVDRENFSLVAGKGLRLNYVIGLLVGCPMPVIILHPSIENQEQLVTEIRQRIISRSRNDDRLVTGE